jgi:hypothetical protein
MTADAPRDRMLLASAVLFATAIAAGALSVPNDLFWHLAIAREIWHHGFPYVDPFAFSTNEIAWSPPEWLGEIAFGIAYVSLGFAGTTLLTLLAIGGCFAAIASAARSVAAAPAAALALLLFAWPAAVHLPMRPLVLGDVCFAVLIARLHALRAGDARGLAWAPLLFALWANLHPSWPMGLAVLWLHALVLGPMRAIATRLGLVVEELPAGARRPLAIAALVSPLAVLARPDGIDGALYPFVHVIGLGDRMREIIEWFAPDFGEPVNLALLVLLGLALALMLADRTRVHALDLALVVLGAMMALRYQRFLPLAAFLATPPLARGLGRTKLAALVLSRRAVRAIALAAVLLVLLAAPSSRDLAMDVHESYPHAAVRWAAGHHVGASRAFNTFEDGGYLLFRRPPRRVFIDSRFDLYARAGVFDDYLALRRGERIAEIVDQYAFDAAFVPTAARDENFAALEAALPGLGFTLAYRDEGTHLWTRETRVITSLHP